MKDKVKIGYVGLGRRGIAVLESCLRHMSDVEIVAICDKVQSKIDHAVKLIEEVGKKAPITTTNYDDLINNEEIDAIFIMTGWRGRPEMAVKSMRAGKYTTIEVGCEHDLSECFMLLDVYEETKTPLMMLENCCYDRREMMALHLAEQGKFGEIVHCQGGYHHFLNKDELFKDFVDGKVDHYRINEYIHRNCETYPTHEFEPISKLLKLNRGNKMLTLSSFSSKSRGLKQYAKDNLGEDNYYANIDYMQGDIINTIITCANGETIHLVLDTTLPRAYYSRNFTVRGTKGLYTEERKVLFFEGMEEPCENNEEEMYETYDHPLYKEYNEVKVKDAHGGMDYLVCRAFIESVKAGTNTPIDAYDSILWLAIGPLSEMSINLGGAPVNVPDFTRGKWYDREPIVEGKYCLDKVCIDKSIKIVDDSLLKTKDE